MTVENQPIPHEPQFLSSKAHELLARYGEPYIMPLLLKHGVEMISGSRTKPVQIKDRQTGDIKGILTLVQKFPDGARALVVETPYSGPELNTVSAPDNRSWKTNLVYAFDLSTGFGKPEILEENNRINAERAADYLKMIEDTLQSAGQSEQGSNQTRHRNIWSAVKDRLRKLLP